MLMNPVGIWVLWKQTLGAVWRTGRLLGIDTCGRETAEPGLSGWRIWNVVQVQHWPWSAQEDLWSVDDPLFGCPLFGFISWALYPWLHQSLMGPSQEGSVFGQGSSQPLRPALKEPTAGSCLLTALPVAGAASPALKGDLSRVSPCLLLVPNLFLQCKPLPWILHLDVQRLHVDV